MMLNPITLAINRNGGIFDPSQLFLAGAAGFLPAVYNPAYVLQTAGGTQAASAGDPIGQWLPAAGTLTLAQSTSANRGTRARRPASGIKNLFTTATATFSTRTFTTSAVQYTLSAEGAVGETITLSGTSTAGPLTCTGVGNRVSLTFTPTAGTLTLTKSAGSVINAQIQFGATATAYQDVVSAADITESGQPDVWHTLWDGVSDYGTFGVQSFGTASLFAAAGQAWTVWGVFRALTASGTLIAKGGTVAANRTLLVRLTSTSLRIFARGTTNDLTTAVIDGAFHVWALRWDGSVLRLYFDNQASTVLSVGTAVEESQVITVAANNNATPENYQAGHIDTAMIDRALSDAEMSQLMSNLNSTYRSGL